jgi:hypothetical protein
MNYYNMEEKNQKRYQRGNTIARGDQQWASNSKKLTQKLDTSALDSFKKSILVLKTLSSDKRDKINERYKMTFPE